MRCPDIPEGVPRIRRGGSEADQECRNGEHADSETIGFCFGFAMPAGNGAVETQTLSLHLLLKAADGFLKNSYQLASCLPPAATLS